MDWTKYQIELTGMTKTVENITKDPYIIGYMEILKNSIQSHEVNLVNRTSKKMVDWYQNHLNDILSDQFVYDKDNHRKTFALLLELFTESEKYAAN
jgi:hypothetical protein